MPQVLSRVSLGDVYHSADTSSNPASLASPHLPKVNPFSESNPKSAANVINWAGPERISPRMQSADRQSERRKSQRHRVLKEGRIVISDRSTIDCVIRDMSTVGAKLRLGSAIDLPPNFDLVVVRESLIFPCALAWRKGDLAGVSFVGEPRISIRKLS